MFSKLKQKILNIFTNKPNEDLSKLEDILIEADFGPKLASNIIQKIKKYKNINEALSAEITNTLQPLIKNIEIDKKYKPFVITLCGINGSGKTTTAAKLIHKFQDCNMSVSLAACDTFRAAADDQLESWAKKLNCPIYKAACRDPASVAFSSISNTKSDVLIIDTAGRLPNNSNLMSELAKIFRVIKKVDNFAPHLNIMVIDATTGQNTLEHVKLFNNMFPISGIILAKIDGGAKGGNIVRIASEFKLPIFGVGSGESEYDFKNFSINDFLKDLIK